MSFGERLKKRREEQSMIQDQVAALFGPDFTRQSVSKWERDECLPEADKLLILAVKLDISIDELFADELAYLKRGQITADFEDKYPGAIAALKLLSEYLKNF